MMMKMTTGKRLRMIRKKEKLILKEVAAICNVTTQTLSRYEKDQRTPDNDFLKIFVKHFNLNTDWLLFGEVPIYKGSDLEKNVKESFIELSELIKSKNLNGIVDMKKIIEDIPENFLVLIEYMLKYPIIRKGIFQFFYLLLKPMIDKHPELLEPDQD
jgi:transcriptional regulator with XRE-family HTH domain